MQSSIVSKFAHSRVPGAPYRTLGADDAALQPYEGNLGVIRKNPHWGTTLDDFLREDGIGEVARAEAVTRVVAWQIAREMLGSAGMAFRDSCSERTRNRMKGTKT